MPASTARVRCWGVTGAGVVAGAEVGPKKRDSTLGSGSPVIGSTGGVGKSHVGRATSRTPEKAMMAASASRTVKGSRSQRKQTSAVSVGTRKVMTVASEMLSQDKESGSISTYPSPQMSQLPTSLIFTQSHNN